MSEKPKIYFACSIRAGREQAHKYPMLTDAVKSTGAILLSEIFADQKLTIDGMNKPSNQIWDTDMAWVKEADALIAEVTNPSLGVGYEIREAEMLGKPVLALYEPIEGRKLSAMIDGAPGVEVYEYTDIKLACQAIIEFIGKNT